LKTQVSILPLKKENLNVVFTSLHGTSITLVPILYRKPDILTFISFPNKLFQTAIFQLKISKSEEPEALVALALADKTNADIVIGTDRIATV
jgi:phosphomannomutase